MAADAPAHSSEAARTVTFVELSGPRARSALASCGKHAAAHGSSCELLAADGQPDLYLLVCRDGAPADVPEGARSWHFHTLERMP